MEFSSFTNPTPSRSENNTRVLLCHYRLQLLLDHVLYVWILMDMLSPLRLSHILLLASLLSQLHLRHHQVRLHNNPLLQSLVINEVSIKPNLGILPWQKSFMVRLSSRSFYKHPSPKVSNQPLNLLHGFKPWMKKFMLYTKMVYGNLFPVLLVSILSDPNGYIVPSLI